MDADKSTARKTERDHPYTLQIKLAALAIHAGGRKKKKLGNNKEHA